MADHTITFQNAQRDKLFCEQLREMKMLLVGEAPLVMEPVAGRVLHWPGTSETAGASSSSSGVRFRSR